MELRGTTAVVTGGAHRVGAAIARSLASAGANVAISYNASAGEAERTVEELRSLGVEATAMRCDVSKPDQVATFVEATNDRMGPIDVLVNSASAFATDRFPPSDADRLTWTRTFDVVLHGAYDCAAAIAPGMLERERGSIINIVDLSAWQPWPNRGAHSVAKAASLALMRQLAVELAPHVRANAIALGPTIAPTKFDDAQIERLRARTLLGRWGGGEEAGRAVRYLIEADAVTGVCLTVDSGEQHGHVRDRFGSPEV
ncbi:MAG: SDR family NAD(P)-dependent oxidoreductase [Acidimicrobiales bacterium]